MLNRFFQDELEYLRDLSREFAREYPTLAPALAEAGSDADVERILQGTAFLTGLLRQRLEDDLPELTQTMIQMLWPHYLRPVPSTSIVEFQHPAKPKVTGSERLAAGDVELESVPVDGTPCRFRTCFDVVFNPLRVSEVHLDSEGRGALRVRFEILGSAKLEELDLDPLRFYLHGDLPVASPLYLWMVRYTSGVALETGAKRKTRRIELPMHPSPVRPVGFAEGEGLFPYPKHAFLGYRLLQEYFTLPQKFLFVDVHGLSALPRIAPEGSFDLVFQFSERVPEGFRVTKDNLRLHCSPVVNLMQRDADPIRLDHKKSNYLVRVADPEPNHFEIYSVDRVVGLVQGTSERKEYRPFYSFRHGMDPDDPAAVYFKVRRRNAVAKPNSDCYLSFVSSEEEGKLPDAEFVSVDLTCTNRRIAEGLKPGDIRQHTDRSPQFADFRNITAITPSLMPPLEGGFHWRLISHLSLNFVSLQSAEALRGLVALYDFSGLHSRQAARATQHLLEAIQGVSARPSERILRGAVVRGLETTLTLQEDRFGSEGELYLFASVLEEFLSLYVTVNSFHRLAVVGAQKGERYEWPPRIGKQFIL